jgi:hypothetical protein
MTNEEHNKYIAWAFIAHGSLQLLMTIFMVAMFYFIFSIGTRPGDPGPPMEFFGFFFGIMFLVQMVFTTPSFVAAYGLLKRKSWARIASIIAGVLSSMSVPIGTAACVYALWFFFGDQWKTVYPQSDINQHQLPNVEARWGGQVMDEEGEVVYRHQDPPDWR